MNQIERLLTEGFISNDYLQEEERCEYLISSSLKKIWAVEMDLFREFDRVCKKLDLTYYAIGGTLLGAARHHGFIPWDDDIDIMMMRDQYEKLCEVANTEFKSPYFFQTHYSDFGATYGHAKLRNSETTCILLGDTKYKKTINQGVFLDVFPADNVVDDDSLFFKQKRTADLYKRLADFFATSTKEAYRWHPDCKVRIIRKILMHLSNPLMIKLSCYFWKKFENTCQRYNNVQTLNFSLLSFQFSKKWMQRRSDYKSIIMLPFEFTKIPVCENYDHALTMYFGDWHKMVRGGSQHEGIIVDTEHPYTVYFDEVNKEMKA